VRGSIAPVVLTLVSVALILVNAAPLAAGEPMLLVVDRDLDGVHFVDPKSYEIVGLVRTGEGPQEIALSPDGKTAYVSNFGDYRSTISVVNIARMEKVRDISAESNYRPHGLAVTKNGRKLYATCEASRSVAEFELPTGKLLRSFFTNEKVTHMLALSPDEKTVWTANGATGNVTYIDLIEGRRKGAIMSGSGCESVSVLPNGKEVWVVNRRVGTILVINATTRRPVDTLECRGYPMRIRFTPDGKRALVSCAELNRVDIFDTATRKIAGRIETDRVPVGIDVTPDGKRAFVACNGQASVTILDLVKLEPADSFAVGKYPFSLAYVRQTP